jgi:hypothetical protein
LDLDTANEINSRNFPKIRYFCLQSINNYLPSKTRVTIDQQTAY